MDPAFLADPAALRALALVILIDIALAGDNAVVVGALAAGLPPEQRRRVIMLGVAAALVLRIGFALVVNQLLDVIGVRLAGGLLLLWVTWKMYRELRPDTRVVLESGVVVHDAPPAPKSFWGAAWAVALADVSMSLDNVLAVASAARDHPEVMAIGIALAVILMGVAANLIAKLMERHRWVGWLGVLVVLYVALRMVWEGGLEVVPLVETLGA
ncbi:YjbE family putative metal transport protein [Thermaurantiacus tibetensis]|uniref:YjbE family putative metal transport protein n=1 Tax=Thermaurantiacus tibetensis TaxID=2759035 RepID=UPI00188DE551|nr:YjbE family putative metal transport protein [Thermaurantiacus tibetensis]